jgi:hypothetical protein
MEELTNLSFENFKDSQIAFATSKSILSPFGFFILLSKKEDFKKATIEKTKNKIADPKNFSDFERKNEIRKRKNKKEKTLFSMFLHLKIKLFSKSIALFIFEFLNL